MLEDWQGVHTPGILYECQNKGLTKLAFRKLLILNGAFSGDGSKRENTGEKKNGTTASAGAGVNRRTPERRLPSEHYNRSEREGQGKRRGSSGSCRSAVQQRVSSVVDSRRNVLSAMQSGIPARIHALRRLRRGASARPSRG